MGTCLSCILGDSEEAASPSNLNNKYIYSPTSPGNQKAKLKSEKIDAMIEKQASEQSNIVKILLLGKKSLKKRLLI
jgi:hypothetical protein